jgi:beta-lactamase class A
MQRRDIMMGATGIAAMVLGLHPRIQAKTSLFAEQNQILLKKIVVLEASLDCRLGVALLDSHDSRRFGYRQNERFPMCSTFKFLLSAAISTRVDQGREQFDRPVLVCPEDIVPHAPVTEKAVGTRMTVAQLCAATMTTSDNTAANLLLTALGGKNSFNAFVRSLGDADTRLDRAEPHLNQSIVDDPRDTTTPLAMLKNMEQLLLRKSLAVPSRKLLLSWMIANTTGKSRIRAGLPKTWRVGDKTGAGENGSANDIAIIWPTGRKPLLLTIYLTQTKATLAQSSVIHAEIARIITNQIL